MRNRDLLLSKLDRAQRDVEAAENDLARVLADLTQAPRAEKTTVSQVIEDAFGKLRAAKSALSDVQDIVAADEE